MYQQTTLDKPPLNIPTTHELHFKDSRSMKEIKDSSVHLCLTSPPYWKIKDYGSPNQIGHGNSLNSYFKKLNQVWAQCLRVLHDGCRLCINIGDYYSPATESVPYHIVPLHSELINRIMHEFQGKAYYLGSIIWQKVSTTNPSGGASVMGSYGYPRNGYVTYFNEYIAIFKKKGIAPKPDPVIKERSRFEIDEWRKHFNGVWNFAGEKQEGGIAVFPEELPRRLIRMFTYEGDTVLDPFLGTGTTTRVALDMGRNSIGYEIGFQAPDIDNFVEVIKRKIRYYDMKPEVRSKVYPTLTSEEERLRRTLGTQ